MRLLDRLGAETEAFQAEAEEDMRQLLGPARGDDYKRFLIRTYGFTCPVEHAIASVPGIEQYLDPRRLRKHELLRRDLSGFQMSAEQISRIVQCPVPVLDSPPEALGWAYPLERAALGHSQLFHHLAAIIPGEVAFTSSYLKVYFGAVGEAWKGFGRTLEVFADRPQHARRIIEAARAAYRCFRTWRHATEQAPAAPPTAASSGAWSARTFPEGRAKD